MITNLARIIKVIIVVQFCDLIVNYPQLLVINNITVKLLLIHASERLDIRL